MQVDVGLAVDVVDLGALAVTQPHRLRGGDLPAGNDAAGQGTLGGAGQPGRAGLAADEDGLLLGDDVGQLLVLVRCYRCFGALVDRHGLLLGLTEHSV